MTYSHTYMERDVVRGYAAVSAGLSLLLLWYGLYFGILGRDLAEVASEQMVRWTCSTAAGCKCRGVDCGCPVASRCWHSISHWQQHTEPRGCSLFMNPWPSSCEDNTWQPHRIACHVVSAVLLCGCCCRVML